ncbi:MAG: WxcM-like domain-containing protein [Ottowia sp.]|nr:WxcM-like domain-containing protein [Ottowia sp.]
MNVNVHPEARLSQASVAACVSAGPLAVAAAGAVLEAGCALGAGAVVGEGAVIGAGALVGEGAIVAAGVRVGSGARICAGAVVVRDVPARAVVQATPSAITGYVDTPERLQRSPHAAGSVLESAVHGVQLYHLHSVQDMRGDLSVAELGRDLPFEVRRCFMVYHVPNAEVRGEHAHCCCKQFLIAINGSVRVRVDDGQQRDEFILDRPSLGLYMPPMVWGTQYCPERS